MVYGQVRGNLPYLPVNAHFEGDRIMEKKKKVLEDCRVLDLSNELGFLCGKILGDLGADVIKVEPPGGDPSRNIGPFYKDIPHPEKSLYWFAYNNNKRGITLNIETNDGRELFKRLIKTADIVVESFAPGYMDGLGLGYSVLSQMTDEKIIMTSITPFGQDGPYRNYKASDIGIMAMSGSMYLLGDPDRPPVRTSIPVSYMWTGAYAALGTLMAFFHRQMTGKGQLVDVERSLVSGYRPFLLGSRRYDAEASGECHFRSKYPWGRYAGCLSM
jgi:crotonobetainyl-CoA:carnitine CoA-transferase CaiB-like acyl-CoA transferase